MSTYILMRILESAPSRYDTGIRILTLGQLDKAYERLTSYIKQGQRVLDIGCGTGGLTFRAAGKGAKVKGIDLNPQMIEIAEKRAKERDFAQNIEFCEMGAAELGDEDAESYDIVMSGLCFSELTEDELTYTLKEIKRILKPEGILLVADETKPITILKKILYWIIRVPLLIITYLITQMMTHPLTNLPDVVAKSGLQTITIKLNNMESFIELVARKPEGCA